jgi:hypothetical protein
MNMKITLGLAMILASAAAVSQAQEMTATPELLGSITLPTGLRIGGDEFGGISGLDYDADADLYYAISDDRSQRAPARFYTIKLAIDADGVHAIDIVDSHLLRTASGNTYPENGVDPEAIRYDAARRSIFWSSEGDAGGRPGVYESRLDGSFLRAFAVPDYYNPNAEGTAGVYGNLAFESLAVSPDGSTLFAATENGLAQDGGKATLEAGSPSRVIGFDIATGEPKVEYVYETGPIFTKATAEPSYNDNGLSDLMMLDETHFLAVERSFASGVGNEINFYVVDIAGATDIAGQETIDALEATPLAKQSVFKIGEGDFGLDIDNIEAITFGPEIDGTRTVVIASDNNFNAVGQFSQFVVFKLAM